MSRPVSITVAELRARMVAVADARVLALCDAALDLAARDERPSFAEARNQRRAIHLLSWSGVEPAAFLACLAADAVVQSTRGPDWEPLWGPAVESRPWAPTP